MYHRYRNRSERIFSGYRIQYLTAARIGCRVNYRGRYFGGEAAKASFFGKVTISFLGQKKYDERYVRRISLVELARRYSNRPELLNPLVRTLDMINNPTYEDNDTVTNAQGRAASPSYVRTVLTEAQLTEIINSYKTGTTARTLAEQYGVHVTTIKKRLRKQGVRKRS